MIYSHAAKRKAVGMYQHRFQLFWLRGCLYDDTDELHATGCTE